MSHSARLSVDITARETYNSGGKKAVIDKSIQFLYDLANGTSDGQINVSYHVKTTGIANTTTVYDLIGSLTDEEGNTLNFDEVVLIAIRNLSSTAANYLTIGPDATNGFGAVSSNRGFWSAALGSGGGTVVAADGGDAWTIFYAKAGIPAAAGSTDELSIVTTGTSGNTWELVILGRDN